MVRGRMRRGYRPRSGRAYRTDITLGEMGFWLQFTCLGLIANLMIEMAEQHIQRCGSEDPFFPLFQYWLESLYNVSDVVEEWLGDVHQHMILE